MAHPTELPVGKILQVEKSYANVQVDGHAGLARLNIFITGKTIGCKIKDLRHLLQTGVSIRVKVEPFAQDSLSKLPAHIRKIVDGKYRWEVQFFKKDYPAIQQPAQYRDPAQYLTDLGRQCDIPREFVGHAIAALLHITSIWNSIHLQNLLRLVKSRKGMSEFGSIFPDQNSLRRFIESQPQFFSVANNNVRRYEGFSEEEFNATITARLDQIKRAKTRRVATGAATAGVVAKTNIIDSVGDAKTVLRKILDPRRVNLVVGLDCEGVNLGQNVQGSCLTLVQISTPDGKIFLFDIFANPELLGKNSPLKKLLENPDIIKVIHDCRSDVWALVNEFEVSPTNVFDTSVAMKALMIQLNRSRTFRIGFKVLCDVLNEDVFHKDDDFHTRMIETPDFWKIRPLTDEMINYAASDVLLLVPNIYEKLNSLMTPIWREYFASSCTDIVKNVRRPYQK